MLFIAANGNSQRYERDREQQTMADAKRTSHLSNNNNNVKSETILLKKSEFISAMLTVLLCAIGYIHTK